MTDPIQLRWRAVRHFRPISQQEEWSVETDEEFGEFVAWATGDHARPGDAGRARLLASAPQLREALQSLLNAYQQVTYEACRVGFEQVELDALSALDAAGIGA